MSTAHAMARFVPGIMVCLTAGSLASSVAGSLACTVENDDGDPFAAGTTPAPTTTVGTTVATGSSEGSGSSSGDSGDSGTASSSGGTDTGATESSGGSGSTSDGGATGMQPQDGMYSPCAVAQDCGVVPALCITITSEGVDVGGFCSETGCVTPAVDCAPSPGGTAVPRCMPSTVDGVPAQACALDCSANLTCPPPMQCYTLDGIGMICG